MDGSRFDRLTKSLGQGASRRTVIRGLLGIGGAATVATLGSDTVNAARRPTPTPKPPTCPGNQQWTNGACACSAGVTTCGADCCVPGQSVCCDNACCFGSCYGEELCCPTGYEVCAIDGCCDGRCIDGGRTCCSLAGVCGDECCDLGTERCCVDGGGSTCIAREGCCNDGDCTGGTCQAGVCIPVPQDPPAITFEAKEQCKYTFTITGLEPTTSVNLEVDIDGQSWLRLVMLVDSNGTTSFPGGESFCGAGRTLDARVSTLEFEAIVSASLTYTCAC